MTNLIQFFLDAGQNQRGIFLRVTEQTRFYRQAITSKSWDQFLFLVQTYMINLYLVPEKYFGEFADYFCQAADKMEAAAEGSSQASG